jgi:phosphoribosylglycinamide formyltransferase 1
VCYESPEMPGVRENPLRLGVLVSGTGSNLQAILDAIAAGSLAADVQVVISNRADVQALDRARAAGVPALTIPHKDFATREAFDRALVAALREANVEWVVLAGFMRVLTARFVDRFPARIINTHPSLLPAFPGVDAPAQAIAHGVKLSGVTVHFVDASLDGGPIIAQVAVPVAADDDAATLHVRIQREEHRLLPQVVRRLAAGLLSCQGRRVVQRGDAD